MKLTARILATAVAVLVLSISAESHAANQLRFTPSIGADTEYNDNIYLDNDNEEDDFLTKVFVGLDLEMLTDQTTTHLNYTPGYEFYDENDDLNAWEHKASLTLEYRHSPQTTFSIGNSYLYTENPFRTFDVIETEFKGIKKIDFTVRKDRKPYTSNTAFAGASFELTRHHTLDLDYRYQVLINDDPDAEDSQRQNPSVSWGYQIAPHYTLDTTVDYTRGDFEERESLNLYTGSVQLTHEFSRKLDGYIQYSHEVMDFEGDETDYMVYEPRIGYSYQVTEHTSMGMSGGYFFKDNDEGNDDSGFSGDFDVTSRFEKGSVQLAASAGQDVAYFGSENLGFNTYYGGSLGADYRFINQLFGNLTGTYRKIEYADNDRDDTVYETGAGLTYVPFRKQWLVLSLSYRFRMLESTDAEQDYQSNRVIFQIILTPGRPLTKNF